MSAHDLDLEDTRQLRLVRASGVKPQPVRWLLHHLIPQAAVTLLAGREGLGKSTMWAYWASEATHGRLPGDLLGTPTDVLVIANEDSREHTLTPRLIAAGADLDRVHFVDASTLTGTTSVMLPLDVARLVQVIRATGASLVIVDPLVSVLDGRLDSHKDHSIRQALDPLNSVASTTGAALLGLVHLNKAQGSDVLDRVLGSRAFTAAARAVLAMTVDPQDETGRLLVFQSKSNLGPRTREALIVEVQSTTIETDHGPTEVGRAVIVDRREVDPFDVMQPLGLDDADEMSDAARWLLDHLVANGGESSRRDVIEAGRKAGHSKDQLARAAKRAGVHIRRSSNWPSSTTWHYPRSPHSPHSSQSTDTPDNCATTVDGQSTHLDPVPYATATTALTATTVGEVTLDD